MDAKKPPTLYVRSSVAEVLGGPDTYQPKDEAPS
jgi:hypothetical protein